MFRVLTILAAVVALAVSAAPASAGLLSSPLGLTTKPKLAVYDHGITQGRKPPPRGTAGRGRVEWPIIDYVRTPVIRGIYGGHYRDGNFAGVKDGSSNTVMFGE